MDAQDVFIEQLESIERIARFICRRGRVGDGEVDDFIAYVKLELIDNDYEVLRKFEGRSTLHTYLTTVIRRLLSQYRTHEWGRWRPSTCARRLGESAIALERLVIRDGHTFEEAVEILTTGSSRADSRKELEAIWRELPSRVPRPQIHGTNEVPDRPFHDDALRRATREERRQSARLAASVMQQVIVSFSAEERKLLRMRFWEERSVADIASLLDLDQKRTYKRIEKLLVILRRALESAGIERDDLEDLTGDDDGAMSGALTTSGARSSSRASFA